MQQTEPLVSIISFCRNRSWSIRRSIESVLGQTYRNIEFVVQDGASTDGTAEILREYAARDSRIKLISEPDSGPAEAFWKVLQRCRGDIIGTCLSDEELLPDAVAVAVERFRNEPHLGAITGDGYVTDADGNITGDFTAGEFDFVSYLFGRYCPFWPGSFFRRQALIDVGFLEPGWNMDCIEFEIWCRLAIDHEIKYFPGAVSKYSVHPTQASNTPANFNEHLQGRLKQIDAMFSTEGFFGPNEAPKLACMINQVYLFYYHACAYQLTAESRKFADQIAQLTAQLDAIDDGTFLYRRGRITKAELQSLERLQRLWARIQTPWAGQLRRMLPVPFRTVLRKNFMMAGTVLLTGNLPISAVDKAIGRAQYYWASLALMVPADIRRRIPGDLKASARKTFAKAIQVIWLLPAYLLLGLHLIVPKRRPAQDATAAVVAPDEPLYIYPVVAGIYDARGQIRQALDLWRHAEPLDSPVIDGLAAQAILKLPNATYRSIKTLQQRWADRFAKALPDKAKYRFQPYDGHRRIRIGYHCSFMESDTIRFIMSNAMRLHDRTQFEIFAYTPVPLSHDLRSSFDVVRETAALPDAEFIDLVRKDGIDVFIELSGFSPGHRYTTMASRCAPVQVSYLNHHGTSCIPAVDYFLSDEISTPMDREIEQAFTEKIYRLPHCLLCYDYSQYPHPPVSDPPSLTRGHVTFGCFGSGSKINNDLIALWSEVLKAVPGSVLYLRNPQLSPSENRRFMIRRFKWFGIGLDRLRLDGGTDRRTLLRDYNDVDISLDTWPYCGGNTVAESLWQGVPVVTLKGDRISSRYGASLLTAAGCADLVADNKAAYVEICRQLAGDRQRLVRLRHDLRQMCKQHGLGDSLRFARDLETAYRQMLTDMSIVPAERLAAASHPAG